MSTCISSHGEYDSHETHPDTFVCEWCHEFDEAGALAEIARLRRGPVTGMEHAIEQAAEAIDVAMRSWEYRWLDDPDDAPAVIARALAEAGLLAPVLLREEAPVDEPEEWRCPGCNSDQWIRASLTRGFTVITQCVPCGRYVNSPPPDRAEGDGSAEQ